jgi:hypothetical protein
VGGAGAEKVVVPNLLMQSPANEQQTRTVYVPLYIPQGSRIAARCQSDGSSQSMRAGVTLVNRSFTSPSSLQKMVAYGISTATTRGTNVDPGGTVHTKGAYSQIAAFTTGPMRQLIVALGYQKIVLGAGVHQQWLIDIATGPLAPNG